MKVSIECDPFDLIDTAAKAIIAEGTTGQLSKLRVRLAKLYEDVNTADSATAKHGTDAIFPPSPYTEHDNASRHE